MSKEETGRQLKVLSGDSQAMIHFKKGDFQSAGRVWLSELKRSGIRFTILLELDCMKESVVNAYLRVIDKERFFILRRQKGPRECYLVMWGRFKTRRQAENAMSSVPEFFLSQAYPPKVYNLGPLLD